MLLIKQALMMRYAITKLTLLTNIPTGFCNIITFES